MSEDKAYEQEISTELVARSMCFFTNEELDEMYAEGYDIEAIEQREPEDFFTLTLRCLGSYRAEN